MIRVPPEIDRLMWAVAENDNSSALDEFGARYPEYRTELLKRVDMVRGLRRQVNTTPGVHREIPKFDPRPVSTPGPPRGMTLALGLAFAACAFAGFTAFNSLRGTPTKSPPVLQVSNEPLASPPVVFSSPTPGPVVQEQHNIQAMPSPPSEPLTEKRRDLNLKDVDLVDAFSLITAGTPIKLEVGPGFVNQKVTLSFKNKTTAEMLRQMASDYAFTVSDEGDGHYLLLPVPDKEPTSDPLSATRRRVGP